MSYEVSGIMHNHDQLTEDFLEKTLADSLSILFCDCRPMTINRANELYKTMCCSKDGCYTNDMFLNVLNIWRHYTRPANRHGHRERLRRLIEQEDWDELEITLRKIASIEGIDTAIDALTCGASIESLLLD